MADQPKREMLPEDWRRRMRSWGIRPARSKGQNFLLDSSVVERIADVASIAPEEFVIEIGPGMGVLTTELLGRGARVHAIELDDTLAPKLEQHFAGNDAFTLVHGNAATIDPASILDDRPYKLVANLPYSVATLIVRHFLECSRPPVRLTVMVQKEVAQRMAADTGGMSLLTLAVQLYSVPILEFDVPKEAFLPAPEVSSSVVTLDVRDTPLLDAPHRKTLFSLASIAFQQRRKTLVNSLSRSGKLDKRAVTEELTRLGIDVTARPQAVSLEQWLTLATSPVLQP